MEVSDIHPHPTAVVEDWKNAEIVPIPKKGDLKVCDNWRGISLLDVVGKVFARIIQIRLQRIAEEILPESQCGFRKGRGCTDMIFVARQLVEKSIEHQQSLFILFVDLRKAYDSVPRDALWQVLEKSGVPPNMLNIIKSFHNGMKATIKIGSTQSESFSVCNGLRQGCTLAPTLFNLYFNAVMNSWRSHNPQAGVKVKYKLGRKLVGDRTTKSKLISTIFTKSQYADDAALYSSTRAAFENTTKSFVAEAFKWGITVNIQKTKEMVVGETNEDIGATAPVELENGAIEMVDDFTYLGSNITKDGQLGHEGDSRVAKAARAFGSMRDSIFRNTSL